jgi:hypothetical protein
VCIEEARAPKPTNCRFIRQARTQVTITKVEIVVEDLRRENIHEPSADLKLGFQASIKTFSRAIKY